jgi:hypothetical protein
MSISKIELSFGKHRFSIEGSEQFVSGNIDRMLDWESRHCGPLVEPTRSSEPENNNVAEHAPKSLDARAAPVTLKRFLAEKRPLNTAETLAVVLFYKKAFEQVSEMKTEEVRQALLHAGARPPRHMRQAMSDCVRRAGYIAVGSNRGCWKLDHQGETLVQAELPRNSQ